MGCSDSKLSASTLHRYDNEITKIEKQLEEMRIECSDLKNIAGRRESKISRLKKEQNIIKNDDIKIEMTDEKIKVIKFYYSVHRRYCDDTESFDYIVLAPYNFCIRTDGGLDFTKIDEDFEKLSNYREEVELPKKWVLACFELYKQGTEFDKKSNILYNNLPNVTSTYDIFKANYDKAKEQLTNKEYQKAIDILVNIQFNEKTMEFKYLIYYDTACCYALLKNKEKMIEYLNKFTDSNNGKISYRYILNDKDLNEYKETEEFKKIIDKVKNNRKIKSVEL